MTLAEQKLTSLAEEAANAKAHARKLSELVTLYQQEMGEIKEKVGGPASLGRVWACDALMLACARRWTPWMVASHSRLKRSPPQSKPTRISTRS